MDPNERDLTSRLDALAAEVQALGARVAALEGQPLREAAAEFPAPAPAPAVTLGGVSTALSRAAVVSFLLVVALLLRTLADAQWVPPLVGAYLGLAYAAGVAAWGWALAARGRPTAPLYAATGALLLLTVALESHTRLGVLSALAAYGWMGAAALGTALAASRTRAPATAALVALGVAGTAWLLALSSPRYPLLALVLLAANAAATVAGRQGPWGAVRVAVLVPTLGAWALWVHRAGDADPWFLPTLGVTVLFFLAAALWGLTRGPGGRRSPLDAVLPGGTVAWAHYAALLGPTPGAGSAAFGVIEVLLAGGLVGAAVAAGRRSVPGASALGGAAAVLLALALPLATQSPAAALPPLAAAAFGLALLAQRWGSGGARLTSYLVQGYGGVYAATSAAAVGAAQPGLRAAALLAAAAVAWAHYRWCRRHPPAPGATFFAWIDRTDDTAVAVFLVALGSSFLAARLGAHQALVALAPADLAGAFGCAQSVIVNLAALGLALGALRRRNTEVRGVALLVLAVGGVKSLVLDLLGADGLPLVLSVLSFGAAAAGVALALARWTPRAEPPEPSP